MKKTVLLLIGAAMSVILIAAVGTTIDDFFMPGSQPGESGNIEHPNKCDNCHGGYDQSVEPVFNWRGSMMAQAARDPLFYACLAIAEQDAPGSGDMCIRCHAPDGWLGGRSTPTDGSALNNNDREGVQCDFCHKLVKPAEIGINPYSGDANYTSDTYSSDQEYLGTITMIPPQSGNGMYIAHAENAKRGPFTDAAAKHQIHYSPFHSESAICGTCHDVSSPAIGADGELTTGGIAKGKNAFITTAMLPVERTFSEWKMSAYNSPGGVPSDAFGGNKTNVSTCQDCHMQDITGVAANKRGTVRRTDLPLHDFTGGNTFIPGLVAQLYPDEVNTPALDAGKLRANYMLQNAASMNLAVTDNTDGTKKATITITNNAGHKLPSGYPEGRRIWINIQAYDNNGNVVFESGAYDYATAELNKTGAKIYEIKLGMADNITSASGAANEPDGASFHFVLNNKVIKDNRIPPRGFTNENFAAIGSPVVAYNYADGQYADETVYTLPATTDYVKAQLLYQTVSKEYVDFLRDENRTNDAGNIFHDLWTANGKSAPVVMCKQDFGNPPTPALIPFSAEIVNFTRNSLKGSKESVSVTLLVADNTGTAIANARVNGSFSGPTSSAESSNTDENGLVVLTSRATRNPSGEWCFNVESVSKEGYIYEGSTSECESDLTKSAKITNPISPQYQVNVYPNPFTDKLSFEFSRESDQNCTIELFDVSGRKLDVVFEQQIKSGQNYKVVYDAGKLTNRMLVYRIQFDEEIITGKVLHQ